MNKILLITLSLVYFACGQRVLPIQDSGNLILDQTIEINGIERNYHIYIPKEPAGKPLVLLLHGNRGNFNEVIGNSRVKSPQKIWLNIAKKNNFIVVVPNGSLGSKKKRGWNDCRSDAQGNPQSNDVLFISKLLDKVKTDYGHNENKVFVAGVSNGGQMAMRLAMEIPNKITAFAAIVASMPVNSKCNESRIPVSALYMNGTTDPILPYSGGQMASNRGLVKSVVESISYWTERNRITTKPIISSINNISREDNSYAVKQLYKNNNTEVAFYKIINGGHAEPSKLEKYRKLYRLIVGNQNNDFEMAEEIWSFFKDKSK